MSVTLKLCGEKKVAWREENEGKKRIESIKKTKKKSHPPKKQIWIFHGAHGTQGKNVGDEKYFIPC